MPAPQPPPALDAAAVDRLVAQAEAAFQAAATTAELRGAKSDHAGDQAPLSLANRAMRQVPPELRAAVGARLGAARAAVERAWSERDQVLAAAELAQRLAAERVDVTLPVSLAPVGAPHPVTALMDQLGDVFVAMGWEIAEGPEVEAEWMNFDALNLGPHHPARATSDTLFVAPPKNHLVLRTHTSPVQIRSLLTRPLPVYVVCPGTTYRADEFDATHVPVFHQIEGLAVDRGITLGHLKGTLDHLAQTMFGPVVTRLRPSYFPFTEPSAEVDLECFVCHGDSVGQPDRPCRTCASEGWIEWGGCGVVNPRVLKACGVDPDEYSGFAFGMGVERTLMFRNAAADMRDMVEGDVRFSRALIGGAR
ncbi:MAG: phenylalanine--tRNA ligase subunit alpha [Propionibacteriaceae bacterium]|nr:phenylalanine--tRNA ligase subunit alpha [Propionibacteriaceae bacterium]